MTRNTFFRCSNKKFLIQLISLIFQLKKVEVSFHSSSLSVAASFPQFSIPTSNNQTILIGGLLGNQNLIQAQPVATVTTSKAQDLQKVFLIKIMLYSYLWQANPLMFTNNHEITLFLLIITSNSIGNILRKYISHFILKPTLLENLAKSH